MPKHARVALKVNDLASSLTFYVDRLGFPLVESQLDADLAVVLDPSGDPLLLAGPAVEDVSAHLDEPRIVYQPGATLDFAQENLDACLAALTARGLTDMYQEQIEEGDRKLTIKDPSDSTLLFVQQHSPAKTLALYARGGVDVAAALAGLAENDLDLTLTPEAWSIRQIVHHLAETDAMHLIILTSALAQSGRTFLRNSYNQDDQDHWAEQNTTQRFVRPAASTIVNTTTSFSCEQACRLSSLSHAGDLLQAWPASLIVVINHHKDRRQFSGIPRLIACHSG